MSINVNDLNYENTVNKRFYLREKGQIIYKYDFFDESIKNLGPDQDLLMEDRSDSFALPEFWYYKHNCPNYIVVTDISSYNTMETDLGKKISLNVTSQTNGNDIILTFDFIHNSYTHIGYAIDLSSESDLNGVTTVVPAGTDSSINASEVSVNLNGFNSIKTINVVNGRASLVIDGTEITYPQLTGHVNLEGTGNIYFIVSNIELISSVAYNEKMKELRDSRNVRLNNLDWIVIRHITQQTIGETTLSDSQFEDLCNYMQDLRDITANIQDIDNFEWPVIPQSLENIIGDTLQEK